MRNVVVLTGRGGSKSIAKKNVYPVLGRPLVYYPMHAAKSAKLVDEVFVSTDCEEIASVARKMDVSVIPRPEHLSGDDAELADVLVHALSMAGPDIKYLISMHCNCAAHRPGLIDDCIADMDAHPEADSCVSGYVDRSIHPYRTKRILADGRLESWIEIPKGTSTNRQMLEPCFVLDGAVRVMRVDTCFPPAGQRPFTYLGNHIRHWVNKPLGDVHSMSDIMRSEFFLRSIGWSDMD